VLDRSIRTALADIHGGLLAHRGWRAFAANDVAQRHRRAMFGRFWIVGTMAATVAAVGSVYAGVMQAPASSYVPFIAAGLVVWQLIASVLTESSNVFTGSEGLMKAVQIQKTFFVARLVYRNLIVFLMNLVIVAIVVIVFRPGSLDGFVFAPVGLLLVIWNLCWITFLIGTLATRFRDVGPLIGSAMPVLFLLTPIIYQPNQLADGLSWIAYLNPLASLVAVLRDPLLGQWPAAASVNICTVTGVAGSLGALWVFARARPLIALWL
jgi:ABC-type polysaccharide/polyol phosphate export permease